MQENGDNDVENDDKYDIGNYNDPDNHNISDDSDDDFDDNDKPNNYNNNANNNSKGNNKNHDNKVMMMN